MNKTKLLAYGLSLAVMLMAIAAWGQGVRWQAGNLSAYQLFPLFGLLAWSLMWSMYMTSFLGRHMKFQNLDEYYKVVGLAVIAAIVLHPTLLIWQLWRDKFGLPPGSYFNYVAVGARWALVLSTTSFLILVAYEFRHSYRTKSWWRFMEYAADFAMVAIFAHSLRLGTNLQHGWFRYVWLFYGALLFIALTDLYFASFKKTQAATKS